MLPEVAHHIGRLDIAVGIPDLDTALALRARLEDIAWTLIPRVLERVFDALAPSDHHMHLARLDLDLGIVRPDHLEQDTLAALERSLTKTLAEAIATARYAPPDITRLITPVQARLEQFGTYLADGMVPFRVAGKAFTPAATLGSLIDEQPAAFVDLLRRLSHDRRALERLVLQAGEDGLRALLALLAPSDAALILAYMADIVLSHRTETKLPLTEPVLRRTLWLLTLDYLLRDAGSQFNRRSFLAFLLAGAAEAEGIAYGALLDVLWAALGQTQRRQPLGSSLPAVLRELLTDRLPIAGQPDQPTASHDTTTREVPLAVAGNSDTDRPRIPEVSRLDRFVTCLADGTLSPLPTEETFVPGTELVLLAAGQPAALVSLLHHHARDRRALERLVLQVGEDGMRVLLALLAPADAVLILAYLADILVLHRAEPTLRLAEPVLRRTLWLTMLIYLLHDPGSQFNRRSFLADLLAGAAEAEGIAYDALLDLLQAALAKTLGHLSLSSSLPAVLRQLLSNRPPGAGHPNVPPAQDAPAGLDARFARTEAGEADPPLALFRQSPAPVPWRGEVAALVAELPDTASQAALWGDSVLSNPVQSALATGDAVVLADALQRAGIARRGALLRQVVRDPALVIRLVAQIGEDPWPDLAAAVDPANARAIVATLGMLWRLHAAEPLLKLEGARFRQLTWALALREAARAPGGKFDRSALLRRLLGGIGRHEGTALEDVSAALRQRLDRHVGGDGWTEVALHDLLRAAGEPPLLKPLLSVGRFLRTGQPTAGGHSLPDLVRRVPAGLRALFRQLAGTDPGGCEALIPTGPLTSALSACEEIASSTASGLRLPVSWPADGSGFARPRTGSGRPPAPLLREQEKTWVAGSSPAMTRRVATQRSAAPTVDALVSRRILSGRDEKGCSDVRLRAAAALAGAPIELASPAVPAPIPAEESLPPSLSHGIGSHGAGEEAPEGPPDEERAALFAWLSGCGPDEPMSMTRLVRRLADLADGGDKALDLILHSSLARAEARARWANQLPDEVLSRLLYRIEPAKARFLLDAMTLLQDAWHQTVSHDRRDNSPGLLPGLPWTLLLARLAAHGARSVRDLTEGLVRGLTGNDPTASFRLLSCAGELAKDDQQASLFTVLRTSLLRTSLKATDPPRPRAPVGNRRYTVRQERSETPAPIFIDNAGLVLFNPFLPRFFDQLGLLTVEEGGVGRIVGIDAASRAVHLLQYLVDERCDRAEPDLALNKLLCGLSPADPIAPAIDPTGAESSVCDAVIQAVIANWRTISNTSSAGLRETFLQREGRLLRGDNRWTLQVQRKTVDVLTDQIPWSFAVVFHRWMTNPVHVTW